MPLDNKRYRRHSVDYLGFLEAKLRDLHGIATLVYEFIQNADDVRDEQGGPGASQISFDVRDDALLVYNNGVFRSIDFDRLERVAGGGKREEAGTTGAFGLGFISAFQITDYPEIFSSGRHWTIRPDKPEEERILEQDVETEGTWFRLPWAFYSTTVVRRQLRLEPVRPQQLPDFVTEISEAIRLAALFLKQINVLEVRRSGELVLRVERELVDGQIIIRDGQDEQAWTLFIGDFDEEASALREKYPGRIEDKRHSQVLLAVSDKPLPHGCLFSGLPSETAVPLPFHLNADLFPATDRKRILFDSDYQSEWNRTAVRCAARILAAHFKQLPALLQYQGLWQFLQQLFLCYQQARQPALDAVFASFWQEITPFLTTHPIVFTVGMQWVTAGEARLLDSQAETTAASIFRDLGIPIVHEALHPYSVLMRLPEIDVPLLSVDDVASALVQAGLEDQTHLTEAPLPLRTVKNWQVLWDVLDVLLLRTAPEEWERAEEVLRACAIAPADDATLRRPDRLARGDEIARQIFSDVAWLHESINPGRIPGRLVAEFDAEQAVAFLSRFTKEELEAAWHEGKLDLAALFRWLESRQMEIVSHPELKEKVRRLPIGPAGSELFPLADLYVPGGFDDPLKMSQTVDLAVIGERAGYLLQDLGARPLTFDTYVRDRVPFILQKHSGLPSDARHRLVRLLAERLGEIRDDNALQEQLSQLPLVACYDGHFRPGDETYARRDTVEVLGDNNIYIAEPVESEAVRALHEWLGVTQEPRPRDVVTRVEKVVAQPCDAGARQAVMTIFAYLAEQWPEWNRPLRQQYRPLRKLAWLPAEGDETTWYQPGQLYAVFQKALFATQGTFLDLPRALQESANGNGGFLQFLGIKTTPEPALVVDHLLACGQEGAHCGAEVYAFLDEHADAAALDRLQEAPVVPLPDGRYTTPDQVFWQEHPFGPFRHQLDPALHDYRRLWQRLGVRQEPHLADFIEVLLEIGEQRDKTPLEDETYTIVMSCWQALSAALESQEMAHDELAPLHQQPVIPDPRRVLTPAHHLFFDDRAGLADKFPRVLANRILPRLQGAWRAMAAAGVRLLSEVVQVQLAAPVEGVADEALAARLQERRALVERVVDVEKEEEGENVDTAVLDELTCLKVEELFAQYRLEAFDEPHETSPEAVPALFIAAKNTLYTVHEGGQIPWPAVARELAQAVKKSRTIGGLAGGIKEILASETTAGAERTLDELGYP